jgi:hypothetical protein
MEQVIITEDAEPRKGMIVIRSVAYFSRQTDADVSPVM